MNSMIRSTVAAGKGQLLKASTRAVPLGNVADHTPHHAGTSVSAVKSVCEAKGCHDPDVMVQDGHVLFHDHNKGSYELMVVKKPKGEQKTQNHLTLSYVLSAAD